MTAIKFGTSGWRAIIAEEFTFANVRRVVEAIARYVEASGVPSPGETRPPGGTRLPILVGYDTRFLSRAFAEEAARIFLAHDFEVHLCNAPTPTPTIAYEILKDKRRPMAGAVNLTASHNPPEYNGIKFSSSDGAPALPEVTHAIEALLPGLNESDVKRAASLDHPRLKAVNLDKDYVKRIAELIDLPAIRRAKLRLAYDAQYGTGAAIMDRIAHEHRIPITLIHTHPDPSFGGHAPDPSEEHLGELKREMRKQRAALGISTDGDADRFGVLDRDGTFISPNEIIALGLDYLITARNFPGGVCRSVATTHLIDAVAAYHHREVFETPVGFKYVGELIKQNKIVIGGEESAGLSIRGHVPEKDGILACLLASEMVAVRGKSLKQQRQELFKKVGAYYNVRVNVPVDPAKREEVQKKIENLPVLLNNLNQLPNVVRENNLDGKQVILEDGSWALIRLSGTEPVARLYCEARTQTQLQRLRREVERLLKIA
ncbi:MAG: phosphoglucomutase/phosphomannomutase family protein [Terriglobia bacterium]